MYRRIKMSLFSIVTLALFALAPTAFASNSSGGMVGGFVSVAGGYNLTHYTGSVSGTSSSDAAGGGMAGTTVKGTGYSSQLNTGSANTSSYATGSLAAGQVTTATGGQSNEANYSAGVTTGNAIGTSTGAAGGDYSSVAHGTFHANYTGAQGNAWIGGALAYGQYSY